MVFSKTLPVTAVSLTALLAASAVGLGGVAEAQPALHHVQYTVGASADIANAEIYYREKDPPNWAEYSHNPYQFTPNAEANLGPNKPWVFDAWLADPDQWALVVVGLPGPVSAPLADPGFVCELKVDDVVVATDSGSKGALCSLRPW
ncbi:hypothetical protein FHR72_003302 [Mycolicibacterium iranicum]|uniref:Secreted protein n=1 Tax=Mycolicibacterium iranicum TaxID=912594 RepID=A0A839QEZ8_MYCIR|nr:hypothetical protein [Mycolicibacterium iranicum]MBB2991812.1 hypothetical protein [Mycolicibacterium iranicum]